MVVERFGAVLRQHRLRAGLTQEELAERAGISVRGLRKLECGRTTAPRPDTVRLLAGALQSLGRAGRCVVVVVDDDELFAPTLGLWLESRLGGRFTVAGSTHSATEAVALVGRETAGIAILDLALGGVETIARIRSAHPGTAVLALSRARDDGLAAAALRAGASGFLVRSPDPDVLVAPLLAIAAGVRVISADLLDALLTRGAGT